MSLLDENGLARVWSKMKTWVGNQLPGDFSGATTASAGIHGLVPAPTTTDTEKFLRGDGSWADGNTDEKVTQIESDVNEDYEVLLSGIASTATSTEGANKSSKFTVNPNTGAITFGTRAANSQVGANSFAQGTNITASGSRSHAEGSNTKASELNAHAEGGYTTASGQASHSEGYTTYAKGGFSHTEGHNTTAIGGSSHAEGENTYAEGQYSHVEGYGTCVTSLYGHAEGSYTQTRGDSAHAEGNTTIASGSYAHAEGSYTTASGVYAHAEGDHTIASGNRTHAEGNNTTASGDNTHAEGYYTIANHKSQHVFGEHNLADSSTATASKRGTYVEIVGNGTASTHSNARTLDWSGNEVLSGKLTVGAAPTNNMDVATKKYVDDADNALNSSLANLKNIKTHTWTITTNNNGVIQIPQTICKPSKQILLAVYCGNGNYGYNRTDIISSDVYGICVIDLTKAVYTRVTNTLLTFTIAYIDVN